MYIIFSRYKCNKAIRLKRNIENRNIYDGHTNNEMRSPKTDEPKLLFLIKKTFSFFNVFITNQCFIFT